MKKYKKSELDVHTYGRGRDKKFIIYTDYKYTEGEGPRWNTTVYPDIEGNKERAIKQALNWLNNPECWKQYAVFQGPTKISIAYGGPQTYSETDADGFDLITHEKKY